MCTPQDIQDTLTQLADPDAVTCLTECLAMTFAPGGSWWRARGRKAGRLAAFPTRRAGGQAAGRQGEAGPAGSRSCGSRSLRWPPSALPVGGVSWSRAQGPGNSCPHQSWWGPLGPRRGQSAHTKREEAAGSRGRKLQGVCFI